MTNYPFSIYYNNLCRVPSDINEHLPTLKRYASECEHVTEFGIRTGCSLAAIIMGLPKIIRAYDIHLATLPAENKALYEDFCAVNHVDILIEQKDVLKMNIEQTDMLFIDTLHTYNQLKQELIMHAPMVNKYIILHDTTAFGRVDEAIYQTASDLAKGTDDKAGLQTAVEEFVARGFFKYKEVFENNNGLTVLERCN